MLIRSVAYAALAFLAFSNPANAGFIAVFSDNGSGGIRMNVSGSGQFLDDGPRTSIGLTNVGNFLNAAAGSDFTADMVSGTLTVDGNIIAIDGVEIQADSDVNGDDILINNAGDLNDGATTGAGNLGNYVFSLTAVWEAPNIAFSNLNLGSFGPGNGTDTPEFDFVSISVVSSVPEPSSMLLAGMAGTALVVARRKRRPKSNPVNC